tara:strand:- start:182 stop:988 length:807 start_codon:yes stop_codon:yes gene_type:complete
MISVIIPTYKSPDMLYLCLQSAIIGQKNQNQIIVVVDGHYDINSAVLDHWKDAIEVLDLKQNVGLCRGTNLGVMNSKYDKVLIVNDDNVFPKDWDIRLEEDWSNYHSTCSRTYWDNLERSYPIVLTPNQIEPYPSMFKDFVIENLGTDVDSFDLDSFWEFEQNIVKSGHNWNGSTLPIMMYKEDYLRLGGWDENYELGMVADWDFFLKCELSDFKMCRTKNTSFYHFASASTNGEARQQAETAGHEYAKYKWGGYIQHNPQNNKKYLR